MESAHARGGFSPSRPYTPQVAVDHDEMYVLHKHYGESWPFIRMWIRQEIKTDTLGGNRTTQSEVYRHKVS